MSKVILIGLILIVVLSGCSTDDIHEEPDTYAFSNAKCFPVRMFTKAGESFDVEKMKELLKECNDISFIPDIYDNLFCFEKGCTTPFDNLIHSISGLTIHYLPGDSVQLSNVGDEFIWYVIPWRNETSTTLKKMKLTRMDGIDYLEYPDTIYQAFGEYLNKFVKYRPFYQYVVHPVWGYKPSLRERPCIYLESDSESKFFTVFRSLYVQKNNNGSSFSIQSYTHIQNVINHETVADSLPGGSTLLIQEAKIYLKPVY